jgi:hypothetical protein
VRACGIDVDAFCQPRFFDIMTKHRFGSWRAADVAHADKDDADFIAIIHLVTSL